MTSKTQGERHPLDVQITSIDELIDESIVDSVLSTKLKIAQYHAMDYANEAKAYEIPDRDLIAEMLQELGRAASQASSSLHHYEQHVASFVQQ